MASKQFDQTLREKPTADDYAGARKEVGEILKGRTIPQDWVSLFKFAYLQGIRDERSGATGEQTTFSKIAENLVAIQKSQPTSKSAGATNTMATSNKSEPVTKADLLQMQKRLAELNDMVEKQLDGSYKLEKADVSQLVAIIRDGNQDMAYRNKATETLLGRLNGDKVKFVELLKGK